MQTRVLGVNIHNVTIEEAVARVGQMIQEPRPHLVVTANPEMVMIANNDPVLYQILLKADLIVPDGIGVVLASKMTRRPLKQRVPGIELMQELLKEGAKQGWRIYFLGAAPGVAERAAEAVRKTLPQIQIVGCHHGYFSKVEEPGILASIKKAKADIIFVAMGVPKQEKWIAANLAWLEVPVGIGVGGSFDVLAGKAKRAPQWMCNWGIEWLYRLITQPKRIGRMSVLPQFTFWVLMERIFIKEDDYV